MKKLLVLALLLSLTAGCSDKKATKSYENMDVKQTLTEMTNFMNEEVYSYKTLTNAYKADGSKSDGTLTSINGKFKNNQYAYDYREEFLENEDSSSFESLMVNDTLYMNFKDMKKWTSDVNDKFESFNLFGFNKIYETYEILEENKEEKDGKTFIIVKGKTSNSEENMMYVKMCYCIDQNGYLENTEFYNYTDDTFTDVKFSAKIEYVEYNQTKEDFFKNKEVEIKKQL